MGLIRPSVLLFALLMTAPAIYRFVLQELDVTELLTRYLIAVPIAAVLIAGFRFVTSGYGEQERAVPAMPAPVESESPGQPS
ncbi:MAG TPA: hypothetical protein VFO77_12100 [Actinoplanes sp.]|nr:hypothetical protein [Actinoplanes sp.]